VEIDVDDDTRPRDLYRALTRQRGGYDGMLFDVQLQVQATRALLWAQTFSGPEQASEFHDQLVADLAEMDLAAFRSRYSVPSSS